MFRPTSAITHDDKARLDLGHQVPFIREFYKTILAEAVADDPPRRDLEEIRHAALASRWPSPALRRFVVHLGRSGWRAGAMVIDAAVTFTCGHRYVATQGRHAGAVCLRTLPASNGTSHAQSWHARPDGIGVSTTDVTRLIPPVPQTWLATRRVLSTCRVFGGGTDGTSLAAILDHCRARAADFSEARMFRPILVALITMSCVCAMVAVAATDASTLRTQW